jgi:Autochaperone Domain Type 1
VQISLGYGGADAGVSADSGGQVTLTGATVTVPGVGGTEVGLRATGSGSMITATDVAVSVTGSGGDAGVYAANGGSIAATGGSVSVVNGAGGRLQNGGSVTMAGTDVTASSNGGFGFLFNGGGGADTLNYSNGRIAATNASFSVQGSAADISLTNTIATANNNTLLETTSSGGAVFNAQGSTLQGVISTDASSMSTVNLTQGTVWTMTGNSNATLLANDASDIIYTPPTGDPTQLASYKTLTVTNYEGVGGAIQLNTYLGDDSAPSDRLIIDGGAGTGATNLT